MIQNLKEHAISLACAAEQASALVERPGAYDPSGDHFCFGFAPGHGFGQRARRQVATRL